MDIDKKIAMVQKEYRKSLKEKEPEEKEVMSIYTLEEVREKIHQGFLFVNFDTLYFDTMDILDGSLKIPFIKDYFDVIEDGKENTILASNRFNASLSAVCVTEKKERDDVTKWQNFMKIGMQDTNIYCDMKKAQSLKHFDYLCYETPTAKGLVYNITFRLIEQEKWYVGTFNCLQKEVFSTGQLFEAFIHEMDDYRNSKGGL